MMVGGVSGAWWSHQDGLGARGVVDAQEGLPEVGGGTEEGRARAAGRDPLPARSLPALCWAWGMGRAARALSPGVRGEDPDTGTEQPPPAPQHARTCAHTHTRLRPNCTHAHTHTHTAET